MVTTWQAACALLSSPCRTTAARIVARSALVARRWARAAAGISATVTSSTTDTRVRATDHQPYANPRTPHISSSSKAIVLTGSRRQGRPHEAASDRHARNARAVRLATDKGAYAACLRRWRLLQLLRAENTALDRGIGEEDSAVLRGAVETELVVEVKQMLLDCGVRHDQLLGDRSY